MSCSASSDSKHFFPAFIASALALAFVLLPCKASFAETAAANDSIVSVHGQLSVSADGTVVDKNGDIFQLRGISTHGIAWYPDYVNKDTFMKLRDELNVNIIRLAMYTAETGGYCTDPQNSEQLKELVKKGIDACIDLDMYVIVDWHILSDNDPNIYKADAIEFFKEITSEYAGCPNILYEICNEPNGGTSWDSIKSYAEDVISTIRTNSPDSIIIVGTPTWSQDVDIAAQSPLTQPNLLYTLHFYAATHKEDLMNKLIRAKEANLPVFVSEFGITEASGSGTIDTESADRWISLLDYYNIGYVYWNLSNKNEQCALLKPECAETVNWQLSDYTEAGQWFYTMMTGIHEKFVPGTNASPESAPAADWSFSNNCSVTINISNSWTDESGTCTQYDITIANNGSSDLSDWRLKFNWSGDVAPKEYWSCSMGGNGSSRFVVPADYNTVIPAGSSINFGMIISSAAPVSLNSISFE